MSRRLVIAAAFIALAGLIALVDAAGRVKAQATVPATEARR